MLPTGQVLYTAYTTTVELYTPDLAPDPVWIPTITGCPTSLRQGGTFTLRGRQLNGLSQCVYYGNDATQATNYPIVRLESTTSSAVHYCKTSNFSTMGLQTGTVVHSCDVHVPSSVPVGGYCLVVVANGITSAGHRVGVTRRWKLFKELKLEIKDKLEVLENLTEKRVPDIIDVKAIRESDLFVRIEEEWAQTVRAMADSVDAINDQFGRSFIQPEQRPEVGPPEPVIEHIEPREISDEEAERAQTKHEFIRGERVVATEDGQRLHDEIHDAGGQDGQYRPAPPTAAPRKAAPRRKAATKKSPPPPRR